VTETSVVENLGDSFHCLPFYTDEGDYYSEDLNQAWSDCSTWQYDDMIQCTEGEQYDWSIYQSEMPDSIPFTLYGYQGVYDMS